MANTQEVKTAEARKEARLQAQEKAKLAAERDIRLSKAEVLAEQQANPKPAAPVATRAQRKIAARQAAEAQAEKDAQLRPGNVDAASPPLDPSRPPSLHDLNRRAKFISHQQRDVARDAAKAAGEAAFNVLAERKGRGRPVGAVSRHQTMAAAEAAMARARASQGQQK